MVSGQIFAKILALRIVLIEIASGITTNLDRNQSLYRHQHKRHCNDDQFLCEFVSFLISSLVLYCLIIARTRMSQNRSVSGRINSTSYANIVVGVHNNYMANTTSVPSSSSPNMNTENVNTQSQSPHALIDSNAHLLFLHNND